MIQVLIQVTAGSCDKHFYNERTLTYLETRRGCRPYPYPYGFIIGTSAADGDCVDCYLITNDRLTAGTIVECEPVGLLLQDEDGEVDHSSRGASIAARSSTASPSGISTRISLPAIQLPPNKPLELTPLRVERDRRDFEGWLRLDRFPGLSVRRSSAAGRWAAPRTTTSLPSLWFSPPYARAFTGLAVCRRETLSFGNLCYTGAYE